MLSNIFLGLSTILSPKTLLVMAAFAVIGLVIGALPGLTANTAIALFVPLTFTMEPSLGLAALATIYCSSIYGGSVSAILLGIPGTVSSYATTLDGYPMAKKGRAGYALGISTVASVIGGVVSALVLMLFTPVLAEQALKFGPAEYFAISVLGLSCLSSVGGKNLKKGLLSGLLGLLISTIGLDPITGVERFTFGTFYLLDGIELVPALMGLFGICAILKNLESKAYVRSNEKQESDVTVGSCWIGLKGVREILPACLRGSIIGTIIGILPGAGTNIATFLAYDAEKKMSKHPEIFGTGVSNGVAAPEAANNGVTGGSMIPLLSLGIPGNATSALFLGAIMVHGMSVGPIFFSEHADIAYSLFSAFLLANLIMAPICLILLRFMKKILLVPQKLLGGIILALCVTGVFSLRNSLQDVIVMIVFGVLGYLFYKAEIPTAPMIVAMVLGSLTEKNLWKALISNHYSWSFLWQRPLTLILLIIAVVSFFLPVFLKYWNIKRRGAN